MQDGASAHYASDVRDWFDESFPERWLARSADLAPADYFLWSYLKDIVYKNKPRILISLKQSIISAVATVNSNLCQKVCESVLERLQRCIGANGHQFEHLN